MTWTGRSALMATIRKTNTKPERLARKLLHAMGYRFRLHRKDLPGTPDVVLPRHRRVVFVHGCFWHRHTCKAGRKVPGANLSYWKPKFDRTLARDRRAAEELKAAGWQPLVVWECELRRPQAVVAALERFLEGA